MKYLCLVYSDERKLEGWDDAECMACAQSFQDDGKMVAAQALQPVHTATTLRVRDGKVSITDGPFAETKDLIAGWMVIDVDSYERAVELAGELSAAPGAGGQPIHEWLELRPFLTEPPTITE